MFNLNINVMKIVRIQNDEKDKLVYIVELSPNIIQRLLGAKNKILRVRRNPYNVYYYGDGGIYYKENGKELGNLSPIGEAIDNFRRAWD